MAAGRLLEGEQPEANSSFAETRERLRQKVTMSPARADLLSNLAVVDALLGKKEDAITEARRVAEMLPISKDALIGPGIAMNLAVVYAWTNELDLALRHWLRWPKTLRRENVLSLSQSRTEANKYEPNYTKIWRLLATVRKP